MAGSYTHLGIQPNSAFGKSGRVVLRLHTWSHLLLLFPRFPLMERSPPTSAAHVPQIQVGPLKLWPSFESRMARTFPSKYREPFDLAGCQGAERSPSSA